MIRPLAFLILAALAASPARSADPPGPVTATVLATASRRGTIGPDGSNKTPRGGMSRLATALERERGGGRTTLLVDGGNFVSGEAYRDPERRDRFLWEIMAKLGYDAVTPGDLELRRGRDALLDFFGTQPSIRVVSANCRDTEGAFLFPESAVIERDGIRFGVTGITDRLYYNFSVTRGVQAVDDIRLEDPETALRRAVRKLRPEVDVVVALLHVGPNPARELVKRVPGIDVAVLGHNPGAPVRQEQVGRTLLLRTGNQGRLAVAADLEFGARRNQVAASRSRTIHLDPEVPREPDNSARILAFLWEERNRRQRVALMRELWRCRELPCTHPVSWSLEPWQGAGNPVAGTVLDETGERLAFRWEGALVRDARPLAERMIHPLPSTPVRYAVLSAAGDTLRRGESAPGGRLEGEFGMLFRTLSAIDLPREDALRGVDALEVPEGSTLLDTLSAGARRGVLLLALARRLESPPPAASFRSYWGRPRDERRAGVWPSPGGMWILDPFAGTPVGPGSRLDPERACVALAARGPGMDHRTAMPGATVHAACWVDSTTFLLAGWGRVNHPRFPNGTWGPLRVPTVWVGDAEAGTLAVYYGAPVPPATEREADGVLADVRQRAFPRVRFAR